ncbi:MAG: hypothetical protein ACLRWP_19900 [Bilophila wadsworthia]
MRDIQNTYSAICASARPSAGVDDIQVRRHGKPTTFRIMARVAPDGRVSAVRFITTTGAGGDSGWNPPVE